MVLPNNCPNWLAVRLRLGAARHLSGLQAIDTLLDGAAGPAWRGLDGRRTLWRSLARAKAGSRIPASGNQLDGWLRQVDALRGAA